MHLVLETLQAAVKAGWFPLDLNIDGASRFGLIWDILRNLLQELLAYLNDWRTAYDSSMQLFCFGEEA